MKYFFSLEINAKPEQVDIITNILGVVPNNQQLTWGYTLIVKDNAYVDFIGNFKEILDGKFDELMRNGINKNDISIWMIYEYDEQCNMEFDWKDMKWLGENEITFCVSCYQK